MRPGSERSFHVSVARPTGPPGWARALLGRASRLLESEAAVAAMAMKTSTISRRTSGLLFEGGYLQAQSWDGSRSCSIVDRASQDPTVERVGQGFGAAHSPSVGSCGSSSSLSAGRRRAAQEGGRG